MYEVKIINDGTETIINSVSTHRDLNKITGSIKTGINTIDSFTFNILPNNTGYDYIEALKTKVEVYNINKNKIEFRGRVLLPKHSMSSNGLFTKTVVCESDLGYLMDSTQRYGEYHNISVKDFLEIIIEQHNKQVSEDKHFSIGQVTVRDNNDSLYRFIGYEKTFNVIKDKLIDRLGGEIRIRYGLDGTRYLDYLDNIGAVSSTEIRLSKNLISITEEKDPSQIITRLVPLGAKKTIIDENGEESEIEERLTISEINNGLDYIDDIEAIEKFGIVEDVVTFDNVTVIENLLRKGQEYLVNNNKVKCKYKINSLDLSLIGLDIDGIDLYNYYKVINPLMGISECLRVVDKTIVIENPQSSSVNIGDKFEDVKNYQLSAMRTTEKVEEVQIKLNNTISTVKKVETNVNQIGGTVGELEDGLIGTNGNVEDIINAVNNISDVTVNNTRNIAELQLEVATINTSIGTISNDINTIKNDIEIMKKDTTYIKEKIDLLLEKLNA